MSMIDTVRQDDDALVGVEMHKLITRLYPICRSITGDGLRATLRILQEFVPLEIREIPTGTKVYDWTVPKEWNIRDAYVKDQGGKRVIDFQKCNLHVLNYSIPVHARMPLRELREHLFSDPTHPEWIPYRTSYYKEQWGFCLSHKALAALEDQEYEVCIDSSLGDGSLTYGELLIPGKEVREILFSCHSCHPSLCNDNLSGIALCAMLAMKLSRSENTYSYRFLFVPGTIGSIAWLAMNERKALNVSHGLVVACVGDSGHFHYKKSRRGDAEIDQAVEHVLKHSGQAYHVAEFAPYGYDERQYCSPGFDLAVGSLTRTPFGQFAEYHSSADNLEFVRPEYLADALSTYAEVIGVLEGNAVYRSLNPRCEPQLGRRGIYGSIGGGTKEQGLEMALLWVLNLADGNHALLEMAERATLPFRTIRRAADILLIHRLIEKV